MVSRDSCHGLGDESRSLLAGNEGRRDNDVHLFSLLGKKSHFSFDELLGHDFSVATSTITVFLQIHIKEKMLMIKCNQI